MEKKEMVHVFCNCCGRHFSQIEKTFNPERKKWEWDICFTCQEIIERNRSLFFDKLDNLESFQTNVRMRKLEVLISDLTNFLSKKLFSHQTGSPCGSFYTDDCNEHVKCKDVEECKEMEKNANEFDSLKERAHNEFS